MPAAVAALTAATAVAGISTQSTRRTGMVVPVSATGIHYSLTTRGELRAVSFTVTPVGLTTLRASVDGATWHTCRMTASRVRCALGTVPPARAEALRVVAVS